MFILFICIFFGDEYIYGKKMASVLLFCRSGENPRGDQEAEGGEREGRGGLSCFHQPAQDTGVYWLGGRVGG